MASSAKKNSIGSAAEQMAKHLAEVLADTYVLAVKTHGYHWNVMGPQFPALHEFFGKMYAELFEAADDIAERIRALGLMPDGSMSAFLVNTVINEAEAKPISSEEMIADLLASHQKLRDNINAAAEFADSIEDIATEDLMVTRLHAHDKAMWMLRAQLA